MFIYFRDSTLGRSDLSITSLQALALYLETLIPEDETPGAIALEIPAKMLEKASRDKSYRGLLEGGVSISRMKRGESGNRRLSFLTKPSGLRSWSERRAPPLAASHGAFLTSLDTML